ncbi:MAG: 4-amino-4-deoxy-L-arabinose transferase [Roseateles depolymerans]|uniref:4-amino-4-deoxy-L-arabinose transferase n=1 Tax=Roseateles depolymerans TaxID=76731 RepID=A0A2W5FZW5_9BURK|nr:MAG: 4-amino-4-deoxy-L-arabinose transferase [Roseateles depolymerans]
MSEAPTASTAGRLTTLVVLATLFAYTLWSYVHSPTAGDFAWSDAPRHALNGIFVHDLAAHLGQGDPRGFAVDYYLRYPALTILFYPPLFSGVLALAYKIFGFSHEVAQATVMAFWLLLGLFTYLLARRWMAAPLALGSALLLLGGPELTIWARQVMLDIPAYALLVASAWCFVGYLQGERPGRLYAAAGLVVAALYTKQTPLFVLPAMLLGLLAMPGPSPLRRRHVWLTALLVLLALIPLVVLQLKFGQINTASAGGSARNDLSRWSLAAWTYYPELLPSQVGWPTLVLSAIYLLGSALWPAWRLPRATMAFLLAWLAIGYLQFTYIMVREPRHDLMVLMPLALFAALALKQCLQALPKGVASGAASWAAALLCLAQAGLAVTTHPVQFVAGYRDAVDFVAQHAPRNSVVMFSGNRDGSFIFNVRASSRADLSVARADKMLFRVAIERERGIQDRGVTPEQLRQKFVDHGIRYLVYDPDFWQDLPSMGALRTLLSDPASFELEKTLPLQANFRSDDKRLQIYRFTGELKDPPLPLSAELVGVGVKLQK